MDEINKAKCFFDILVISNNIDRQSAIDFLKKYYFRDEPLNASIGLLKEKESVIQLENFCDTLLYKGKWYTAYKHFIIFHIQAL